MKKVTISSRESKMKNLIISALLESTYYCKLSYSKCKLSLAALALMVATTAMANELNDPFFLINTRVGYQSESVWSAHLYARNLLDEQYLARKRADGFSSAGGSQVIGASFNAH